MCAKRLLVVVGIMLGMSFVAGCGKGEDGEASPQGLGAEQGPQAAAPASAAYPAGLSSSSSPTEVAQALIKALDEEDEGTLLGLVAAKAEAKDIEAIFEKHGRKTKRALKAAPGLAAAGWQATYAFCQSGQTTVTREEVAGETATVFAAGKAPDGSPKTLKIKLVREDGVWKVKGGLETVMQ